MATAVERTQSTARRKGLTEQQRSALWYASQGYALDSIATEMFTTLDQVKNLLNTSFTVLGASNLVHAVALALHQGYIGRYCDCGTHLAYLRHVGRDEVVDLLCKQAHYRQVVGASRCTPVTRLTPTQIKVLRALYMGAASLQEAADAIGMNRDRIGSHVSAAYRKLGVSEYPWAQRRALALQRAEQLGVFK